MMKTLSTLVLTFLLPAAVWAQNYRTLQPEAPVAGQKRVALVIGNQNYTGDENDLKNPRNDATDIASALQQRGFTVVTGTDLGHRQMDEAIDAFIQRIGPEAIALFFYAGHGVGLTGQAGSFNYLIPVDTTPADETDVKYETVNASQVLERMSKAGAQMTIMLLDACRDNPFDRTRSWRSAGSGGGWAVLEGSGGIYQVYGTAPGKKADDNEGERNGLFTKWLLHHMASVGVELREMVTRVQASVHGASEGRQQPWAGGFYVGNFYFTPGRRSTPSPEPPAGDPEPHPVLRLFGADQFVPRQPGRFRMGSTYGPPDEAPMHTVRISRGFEMGKYEVTQAQWEAVMGTTIAQQRD